MIICIDFDGTMVDHTYPTIGEPAPDALKWVHLFITMGAQIILWIMRSGDELGEAADYMERNGIKLFGINENPTQSGWTDSPKAYGHMYIDDAAVGCPLINVEGFNRMCVDWEKVGPMVVSRLINFNLGL